MDCSINPHRFLVKLATSVVDLIYPPLCRHCQTPLKEPPYLLCTACCEHLVLAEAQSKCPYCFSPVEGRIVCVACASQTVVYQKCVATCDARGPAVSLLRQFQQGAFQLHQAIGSLMAMQVLQLQFPLPDLIIPLPSPYSHQLRCGFDRNRLLAGQIGKILQRPVERYLSAQLKLRKGKTCCDQRVLLITDHFDRARIQRGALALSEGFALAIDVIYFAS